MKWLMMMLTMIFVIEQLKFAQSERLLSAKHVRVLAVSALLAVICVSFVIQNVIFSWLIAIMLCCFVTFVHKFGKFSREKRFVDNFCHLLDVVVLEMKSGKPFRHAIHCALDSSEPYTRSKITRWLELFQFATPSSLSKSDKLYFEELKNIDKSQQNTLQRVQALRYRLHTLIEFRQKSGQATAQARAQSVVMSFMYVGATLLSYRVLDLQKYPKIFALSLGLFLIGLVWIGTFSKRYKWKT